MRRGTGEDGGIHFNMQCIPFSAMLCTCTVLLGVNSRLFFSYFSVSSPLCFVFVSLVVILRAAASGVVVVGYRPATMNRRGCSSFHCVFVVGVCSGGQPLFVVG